MDSECLVRMLGIDDQDVALLRPAAALNPGTRDERCPICGAIARYVGRDGRSLRFRCPDCGLEFSVAGTRDRVNPCCIAGNTSP
jgi:transposase-like protein